MANGYRRIAAARAAAPLLTWLGLVLSGVLFGVPDGLSRNAWMYFAVFAAVIVGLILEPIPGGAIGLIGVTFAAAMRYVNDNPEQSVGWALGGFSDRTVWLTFGAFIFSLGYAKTGLGRRIALILVRRLGRRTLGLGYAVALADLALAPGTPSNTARSGGIVFPIISSIPGLYGSAPGSTARRIGSYLMWTAFASMCVTSSMFVTALAPNAAAVSMARSIAGVEINWFQWMVGFLPIGIVLLALVPLLAYVLYPPEIKSADDVPRWAAGELIKMGKVSRGEWIMIALVLLAVLLWVAGSNPAISLPGLGSKFIDPTTVVLIVIALMLATGVVAWSDIIGNKAAWDVLVWFATLVTLANGLNAVGFVHWLGEHAAAPLAGLDPMLAMALLVVLFFAIHYLFASVTAHTLAVLPILLAVGIKIPEMPTATLVFLLVYSLGLMGVITPYATGPAAIFYGSGYISRTDFWRLGFIFGIIFLGTLLGIGIPYLLWLNSIR
jgi:anion transporter